MITYKPIIIQGGRRKDGTWPVKIRVTFKGVARRLPTTLTCTDQDLTRSGRIKNATILEKAGELITRMRATTESLSPFALEAWDVDRVVEHIRTSLATESFRLDYFAFGREFIQGKDQGTRAGYTTALNSFARFLGKEAIDVNEITRTLLVQFQEWADTQGRVYYNYRKGVYQETGKATAPGGNSGRWLSRLGHIYQAAKNRYNDEDAGRIVIPRSPFDNIPKPQVQHEGESPLPVEVIEKIIAANPEKPQERITIAAFLVSLGTMGANLADLYHAEKVKDGYWEYYRRKTTKRRPDKAKVIVRIEPEIEPYIKALQQFPGGGWLPGLRWWKSTRIADTMLNKYLRQWCEKEGLEPFKFYAARHTFATSARRLGVELATIDEALGHKGNYPIADIYAERNWALAWEANRKVLDQYDWGKVGIYKQNVQKNLKNYLEIPKLFVTLPLKDTNNPLTPSNMNTYKLTATALKNGKTLYQVINENGEVISKRTSTRKYVACTIDGSYYFGRLDLIGKGDHGKVLANIQDCKVNTLEKYEAEVKRNIREIRLANKAHLNTFRRFSTEEQMNEPISDSQRDLLIKFYGQEVADSVHTQWEYQVATCNDEHDIRNMMERLGDYETWKKDREDWAASREEGMRVAYLAN